jgi:hypothetical protein
MSSRQEEQDLKGGTPSHETSSSNVKQSKCYLHLITTDNSSKNLISIFDCDVDICGTMEMKKGNLVVYHYDILPSSSKL